MTTASPGNEQSGWQALASGRWTDAVTVFEATVAEEPTPRGFDGLARGRWWLADTPGAIDAWEHAYRSYRRTGDEAAAARTALFLAGEYAEALGNEAAANGWLARAERVAGTDPSPVTGWLLLARAHQATSPRDALRLAEEALATARRFDDPDLELTAMARTALARIQLGDVDMGMAMLDEAMVAAAAGEPHDLRTIGDVYCCCVQAGEVTLDMSRFDQWTGVVMGFLQRNRHADLFTFCGTCCAEVVGAAGDWAEFERWLVDTLRTLEATGQRPRCVHPGTRLATLRIQQGRLEEAEQLLVGYEDLPEAVQPMVALHLARGQTSLAAARLHRRLNEIGRDNLLATPLLVQLAETQLARGDLPGAGATAETLREVGERSGLERIRAEADLATGSVMTAEGRAGAAEPLRRALDAFVGLRMPHAAGRARMALARAVAATDAEMAVEEARQAMGAFERLGATRDADAAAAFLRSLGVRGRTGPKAYSDVLSKREIEVLRLLGEGLTNAEIAARLYISTKTVGTHVGNVLSKLGLRNRAGAAAYAERHLPAGTGTG